MDRTLYPLIISKIFIIAIFIISTFFIIFIPAVFGSRSYGAPYKLAKPALKAVRLQRTLLSNKKHRYIGLKSALLLALKHYPGILSSKYTYIASGYTKNQSTYLYYPQVSVNAGFSKNTVMDVNENNGQVSGIGNIANNYAISDYYGNINASLMLYSFGSRYYGYKQALYNMMGTKYGYSLEINSALYNVVFDYVTYFGDKELERANKENLKNTEMEYKAAEAFYKIGTGDLLDAKTAKATMESAKAAYITSKFNLKIAKLALFNAIGIPVSRNYYFINTLKFTKIKLKLKEMIDAGLKFNPQLKQVIYTVKSSKAAVAEATTGYYPALNANFTYTGSNSSFPLNRNYIVGISINIPVFNGFLTPNKIGYAKASLNSQLWNKALVKDNLIYSISQDYYSLKSQYLTQKALKQSYLASKLAYKLALKSYQVGVGSMVQLVTADAQYISSETNYINAKFTYGYEKAKLYSDLGLMLPHYLGILYPPVIAQGKARAGQISR